jgi:hypothetical protein
MGNRSKFKKEPKQFRLVFPEDTELHGLEVLMRSVSIRGFLDMTAKFTAVADDPKASMGIQRDMFKYFAANLVEWNLVDEHDEDVPPVLAQCAESGKLVADDGYCAEHRERPGTLKADRPECNITGILGQELDFILSLYKAWQEAMAGVDPTSPSSSHSGPPSLEESLPMDIG